MNFGITPSAFTPVPLWSAISAAAASSTTPRTTTPSIPQRDWRLPTSFRDPDPRQSHARRTFSDLIRRGRSEPLRVYEPLPADAFKAPSMVQYSQAFAKLEAGGASAMPAFAALVGSHADYPLAGSHLKRSLNGAKGVRMQLERRSSRHDARFPRR